jgi:hypothetical protein
MNHTRGQTLAGEQWACAHDGKLSKAPSDLSILLPRFEAPGACSFIHEERKNWRALSWLSISAEIILRVFRMNLQRDLFYSGID